MGSQDAGNTNDGNRYGGYLFDRLPENIRQMGELPAKNRIYIEDYVMTYMHQIFRRKQENAIVILVGKQGEKEAEGSSFTYGAMEISLNILEGVQNFNAETWDKIYELLYQHFPGAEVLGWGCGVSMWNSQVDGAVQEIQKKYFAKEGRILFLEDLSEREEKVFCWRQDKLEEQTGYVIYYEKNPQMQDYMLLGQPKKSFEASYEDKVTATVRDVVHSKREQTSPSRLAMYSAGIFLVLLTALGANLLIRSTKKIDSLEKTIETLSNAAVHVTETPQAGQDRKKGGKTAATDRPGRAAETDEAEGTPGTAGVTPPKVPEALRTPAPQGLPAPKTSAEKAGGEKSSAKPVPTPGTAQASAKPADTPAAAQGTGQPAGPRASAEETSSRAAASYVVRYGDTLSQIVWRQYHTLTCLEMVKKANKIKDGDKIKEGQVLYLPAYP